MSIPRKLRGISDEWEDFRDTVLSEFQDEREISRIRPIFYSGAAGILRLLQEMPDEISEEITAAYLERLDAEIHDFFRAMKRRIEDEERARKASVQ